MGSLNGIAHQIATLERRWPAPPPPEEGESSEEKQRREDEERAQRWWAEFQAAAPAALWDYAMDVYAEIATSVPSDVDMWLSHYRPAFKDAVESLHRAFHQQLEPRLSFVQGDVVRLAEHRLGYRLAAERAGGRTAVLFDHVIRDQAATALLGWSGRDATEAWLQPRRFIERWRQYHTDDASVLEKAGLFEREVQLLEEDA